MNNRVSIIMGIYNCETTLKDAIESLLCQTYADWKLIMCDDGSMDNTYDIAEGYRKLYPDKIILIRNDENRGLNFTLNRCLEYADGQYIARMDGDDVSLPERLEKEVAFLEQHPEYAIVSTPMIYFDAKGEFRKGEGKGEPNINSFAKGTPFCHAPCMVRKEAYDAVEGYSLSRKRLRVEDWDLWIRMYAKGFRGYNLREPLYKMRDDRNAYGRRKFKYRINECRVGLAAIRTLNLSKFNLIWVVRPIIAGITPRFIYEMIHKRKTK